MIWREVGALVAAKHFISHTPVQVMDLPVADVVDSKEQLRAHLLDLRSFANLRMCTASRSPISGQSPKGGGAGCLEVQCGGQKWNLLYSDDAIRAFGLDPRPAYGGLPCRVRLPLALTPRGSLCS